MDIAFTPDRLEAARSFANKIWNAARFLFTKMEAAGVEPWIHPDVTCCLPERDPGRTEAPVEDRWIFSRLNEAAERVNSALSQHRYHEAADTLRHFFWDEFCDWYIELKKLKLAGATGLNSHWRNILTVFDRSLRLLHPIMPFLTEELWQRLAANSPGRPASISLVHYPKYDSEARDLQAEVEIQMLQDIVTAARGLRADHKVDKKAVLQATLYVTSWAAFEIAIRETQSIDRLANIKLDARLDRAPELKGAVRSTPEFDLFLQVPESDSKAVKLRLTRENDQLQKLIANSERQLTNEEFLRKAPEDVVTQIKQKMAGYQAQMDKNRATLTALE
jgi:valyl-tRNA synthetase